MTTNTLPPALAGASFQTTSEAISNGRATVTAEPAGVWVVPWSPSTLTSSSLSAISGPRCPSRPSSRQVRWLTLMTCQRPGYLGLGERRSMGPETVMCSTSWVCLLEQRTTRNPEQALVWLPSPDRGHSPDTLASRRPVYLRRSPQPPAGDHRSHSGQPSFRGPHQHCRAGWWSLTVRATSKRVTPRVRAPRFPVRGLAWSAVQLSSSTEDGERHSQPVPPAGGAAARFLRLRESWTRVPRSNQWLPIPVGSLVAVPAPVLG